MLTGEDLRRRIPRGETSNIALALATKFEQFATPAYTPVPLGNNKQQQKQIHTSAMEAKRARPPIEDAKRRNENAAAGTATARGTAPPTSRKLLGRCEPAADHRRCDIR